jgi:hypothetical protein
MVDQNKILKDLETYFVAHSILQDKKYRFTEDGKLDVYNDLRPRLYEFPDGRLPFAFGKVTGTFNVRDSRLVSLEGCPYEVTGNFLAANNLLSSLEGSPEIVGGTFECRKQLALTTLVGAPKIVGGIFNCSDNLRLVSLEGLPQELKVLLVTYTEHLPLLRALTATKGVQFWWRSESQDRAAQQVREIINKYAGQGKRAMFDCQKDLEDAGFEENARW